MIKLHLVFLIGAVTASLDTFIEMHFSDKTICLTFNEEINYRLSVKQSIILFNVSKPLVSRFGHRRVNYLLIVKDIEDLVFVINKLALTANYSTKEKHLILIQEHVDTKQLNRCFALLWQQDIYNVVITTRNNTSFSTWYPYGVKGSCGNTVISETNIKTPFTNKIPSRFTNCNVTLIWKYYPVLTTSPKEKQLGVINQMLLLIGEKVDRKSNV